MHGRAALCYGLLQEQHAILQLVVKYCRQHLALMMKSEKRSEICRQRNLKTRPPYVQTTAHPITSVTSLQ